MLFVINTSKNIIRYFMYIILKSITIYKDLLFISVNSF